MHRVYLSQVLPETSLIQLKGRQQSRIANIAPDIRQKLQAHSKEQGDYRNSCPEISFFPMSKYEINKETPCTKISAEMREKQLETVSSSGDSSIDVA